MNAHLLDADSLALRVGPRTLLRDLTLRIAAGELWCVLGANGSGKTTLLHTLAGLRAPDSGNVHLAGRSYAEWSATDAARRRGLLPQALHDSFSATALDVVLTGRHPHLSHWAWESDADRALAQSALDAVDLAALASRDVTTLSGGERRRVGIAALLAQEPELLLLDEPLAHLDLKHQIVVLRHLAMLARERTRAVLLSIHDLDLARRFATHALVLGGDGSVPVQGTVDEAMNDATLSAAFGHPVRRERIGERVVFVAG